MKTVLLTIGILLALGTSPATAATPWFSRLQGVLSSTTKVPAKALVVTTKTYCGLNENSTLDDIVTLWGKPTSLTFEPSGWFLHYAGSVIHADHQNYFLGCTLDIRTPGADKVKHPELGITLGQPWKTARKAMASVLGGGPVLAGAEDNKYGLGAIGVPKRALASIEFSHPWTRNDKRAKAVLKSPLALAIVGLVMVDGAKLALKPSQVAFDGKTPRVLGVDEPTMAKLTAVWGAPSYFRFGDPEPAARDELTYSWASSSLGVKFGKKTVTLSLGGESYGALAGLNVGPKGATIGMSDKALTATLGEPKQVKHQSISESWRYGRMFSKQVSVEVECTYETGGKLEVLGFDFTWKLKKAKKAKKAKKTK